MASLLTDNLWLFASWLAAMAGLVLLTRRLAPRRWRSIRTLHRDTQGGSYVTSLLLCFPLYATLIAAVVETSILLMVAIGMQNAAHAAGRSARVWLPAECSQATIDEQIHRAAFQGMTPLASADPRHAPSDLAADPAGDDAYLAALHAYGGEGLVSDDYIVAKRTHARSATRVECEQGPSECVVRLEYDAPIRIPGMGPVFGTNPPTTERPYWSRTLKSQVVVVLETPVSDDRTMGIRYGTPH